MHKYHIADILTFARFFCVGGLFVAIDARMAFLIFAIGELTDAFDGIAARRWPYPNDGKRRWWREYADAYDKVADIALALAALWFITRHVNFVIGLAILLVGAAIAIPIEYFLWYMTKGPSKYAFKGGMGDFYWKEICAAEKVNTVLAERVALKRRYLYILGLAVGLLILLWAPVNEWSILAKALITIGGVLIGVSLWITKRDRRTEWHTPLKREEAAEEEVSEEEIFGKWIREKDATDKVVSGEETTKKEDLQVTSYNYGDW